MDSFAISDLERYSGIKAHTIRIWEQRYNALQPNRSDGNTRYYNGSQLKRLLNIVSLVSTGRKVSEICRMTDEQLIEQLKTQLEATIADKTDYEFYLNQLVSSAMEFNEIAFNTFFSNCIKQYGLKKAYIEVIYPTLVRIGLLWSQDEVNPAHEHFITNLFQQKITAATDNLPINSTSNATWVLFLPENEFHKTGLLLAHYLIRESGNKVIFLGDNVPLNAIETAINKTQATHLLLFLVKRNDLEDDKKYVEKLCVDYPNLKIVVIGNPSRINHLLKVENLITISSVLGFENLLTQLK